ncbi:MAG: branched-chain amino acid transaminase [Thermodesulfobacteriota bacterium]|nr:branched-chain amino acid transaminase [Thermodesulfobacteriota bacterium]
MIKKVDTIWLDGKLVDWDKAQIHVLTHTLHYGLGVFEGIRCYLCQDGRSAVFKLQEHVDRLFDSAHISQITIPFRPEEIFQAIIETLRANKLKEGYIRPIVFIGDGEMGLYVKDYPVRVAIACWPWGAYLGEEGLRRGIRAKIASFTRHHVNVGMTKAKICGNYVNSILAKKEVTAMGYDEAILLDTEGYICEASGENIFIVKKDTIKTPPPTSILQGITRDSVIRLARDAKMNVVEQRFTRDELYIADEAFFTGTAAEITPIREVDDRTIGRGERGPVTEHIQKTFFDVVQGKNDHYKDWLSYL